MGGGGGGGGRTPMKKRRVCLLYLLGFKKVVLVQHRVFSLKRSTAGAFAVPFRVLSIENNITRDI